MKRDLWNHSFSSLPKWTCPACESGSLIAMEGFPHSEETEESKRERQNHPEWEPEWVRESFVALLKCDECGEVVTVAGTKRLWTYEDYENHEQCLGESFFVRHVYPAPHIIEISEELPAECAEQLELAFELYWVDKAAAANRLRILVERLMDHLNVPVEGNGKNDKIRRLNLSERIDEFEKMKPGHKAALDALRFVGNHGSHAGQSDQEVLLDAFEVLEDALSELIDNKKAKLAAKAKALIQSKGNPEPWIK
ncbi:DUF4145 domain-containing protein [Rhizobium anhuiense]|uniref:DUF4145 domain-containing protein n=1 Tax=Rhizobium anhuiense TaxID=1184720 RepID=UPI0015CF4742|nr:DUF4145 domain-containing protein [Rhizobium anhuiense]